MSRSLRSSIRVLLVAAAVLPACGAPPVDDEPGLEGPAGGIAAGPALDGDEIRDDVSPHERCATRPVLPDEEAAVEAALARAPRVERASGPVPVWVHVITRKSGTGGVAASRITAQIAALNQAYAPSFSFTLAGTDRTANDAWFVALPGSAAERDMKTSLRQGDRAALNLYLASPGNDLLGWATFPWDQAREPELDGVVVRNATLPRGSLARFNEGDTAVHETGHWLGLFHTFQGGCSTTGDGVSDTPAERAPTSGCPSPNPDTCAAKGVDPIHNFMDYSDDACMFEFSSGQRARMAKMAATYR